MPELVAEFSTDGENWIPLTENSIDISTSGVKQTAYEPVALGLVQVRASASAQTTVAAPVAATGMAIMVRKS
jgi:hypothetical protein